MKEEEKELKEFTTPYKPFSPESPAKQTTSADLSEYL